MHIVRRSAALFALVLLTLAIHGTASSAPSVLHRGHTGPQVRELQRLLNTWLVTTPRTGMRLLVVDGIFGPQTERAVRTFQHTMGLYADGVVGPLTRARLLSAQPRRSATPTRSTSTAVPQAPTSMLRPTPARTAIAPSPTLPPQARADPCTGIAAPTNVAATDPNPLCVETSDIMHLYLKGFTVGQEFRYYVTTPGGLMRGRPRFGHIGAGPLGNGLVILASGTEFGPALLPGNYVVVIEGLPAATPRASAPFRILP